MRKRAHGWSLGGTPCRCYRMVPTPVVEASTSTVNGNSGSGWTRRGALVKASYNGWKALTPSSFQTRDLGFPRRRLVNWQEILDKFPIEVGKPNKSLELFDGMGSWPRSDGFHLYLVHLHSMLVNNKP